MILTFFLALIGVLMGVDGVLAILDGAVPIGLFLCAGSVALGVIAVLHGMEVRE